MQKQFDKQLLLHIRNRRNDEAKAMLNEELARAFDESSTYVTLLHYAAEHNNAEIARRLIELGADVDHRFNDTSPLVIAVLNRHTAVVQVLLEADARLDVVDNFGNNALQEALNWNKVDSEVFKLLICKLRTDARTNEELAETLIRAGCNMCHAAALRDVEVMECMLRRGFDVHSKGSLGMTALHVSGVVGDVHLADWLLKKGADVDKVDDIGCSALRNSVWWGKKAMVQFLLERGACVDFKGHDNVSTALYVAFTRLNKGFEELVDCIELLLQYGATLPKIEHILDMFYFALSCSSDKAAKLLIAHLAMLEMLGNPIDKSVVKSVDDTHQTKMSELLEYYEPCQQVLTIKVFEKLSLLDLLNESDRKMRLLVRKETLFREVEKVSSEHKLSKLYPYYYNTLMRRIKKAKRVVKLEDEASLVICKIFDATYNLFYGFARGVVEHLNEHDLDNLVQV